MTFGLLGAPPTVQVTSGPWIGDRTPLVLRLDRALEANERLVVTIGARDITPQLVAFGLERRYHNTEVALAAGTYRLRATLVTDDSLSTTLLTQTIRVEGALGVRERKVTRSAEAGVKSRVQNEALPEPTTNDRRTYNDYDGQAGLGLAIEGSRFSLTSRAAIVGASHRPNALRFRVRGDRAPLVDLTSFLSQLRVGPTELSLGHLAAGSQRHLQNNFASRGAGLRVARGRVDASVTALHGSQLVGWDDALGFTRPDHRMLTTAVGVEALKTPGAFRVELSTLNGSILPVSGFNQGAVTDAERSEGLAVRVQSAFLARRGRVEAGFARSTFDNPPDRFLGAADSLVEIARETRDARYVDAAVDVLRNVRLGGSRTMSLSLGAAHERVDPLYRSVGTYVQSDRQQDRYSLRTAIAGLSLGVIHATGENNVDRIASILTTRGIQRSLDVSAPLATIFGMQSRWLPTLNGRASRNHSLGVRLPTAGGFNPSHVPDQISTDRNATLGWQFGRAQLALQAGRSDQDNRQVGRERADLRNTTRGAQGGVSLHRHANISLDAQWTRAESFERDVTERIRRLGANATLFGSAAMSLALQFAGTRARTPAEARRREDLQWSAQLAWRMPRQFGQGGRGFLRFQAQESSFADAVANTSRALRTTLVDAGLTLRLP
ncbi:MAG: hypothetical protein IT357_02655 [Gemmatimonadaceae bacterium]|nr:hypothetical protein [Gemmatimonadaceae bacterium]